MKRIVAMCPAGLGNRIKCMVSTAKRCDDYMNIGVNAEAHVYWPVNNACGCEFEELFKPSIIFNQHIDNIKLEMSEVNTCHGEVEFNKSWKLKSLSHKGIDFQYHKLSKSIINEFLPYFGFIEPAQDIEDTVWAFMNKYKESFDKGEVIGVHLRKGDFKGLYDGRNEVSSEDDFIERMACLLEVNPNYKFLLCTEDKKTEDKFKEIFGVHTILIFPKRFRGRDTPKAIKEAFVDMLLLSKCPIIIGTFLSTFTELAWWLGGCKAQVYIPGTQNKEAVAKVLSRIPKEGESIHKKVFRRIMIWIKEGI